MLISWLMNRVWLAVYLYYTLGKQTYKENSTVKNQWISRGKRNAQKQTCKLKGAEGKKRYLQRSVLNAHYLPQSLQLLVLLQKLEPQQKLHVPRWRFQKASLT